MSKLLFQLILIIMNRFNEWRKWRYQIIVRSARRYTNGIAASIRICPLTRSIFDCNSFTVFFDTSLLLWYLSSEIILHDKQTNLTNLTTWLQTLQWDKGNRSDPHLTHKAQLILNNINHNDDVSFIPWLQISFFGKMY
jgi:hypothetical protein